MKWICDTNVISEIFKKQPNNKVLSWLSNQDEIWLSVITVEEIFCGLSHKRALRKMEWFEKFIQNRCHILPMTTDTAKQCGILHGRFLSNGITRTQADLFIAATANAHNLALATRNEKDFSECGIPVFNPFT
jgi:predicted nucleic acid-binding protein